MITADNLTIEKANEIEQFSLAIKRNLCGQVDHISNLEIYEICNTAKILCAIEFSFGNAEIDSLIDTKYAHEYIAERGITDIIRQQEIIAVFLYGMRKMASLLLKK